MGVYEKVVNEVCVWSQVVKARARDNGAPHKLRRFGRTVSPGRRTTRRDGERIWTRASSFWTREAEIDYVECGARCEACARIGYLHGS